MDSSDRRLIEKALSELLSAVTDLTQRVRRRGHEEPAQDSEQATDDPIEAALKGAAKAIADFRNNYA